MSNTIGDQEISQILDNIENQTTACKNLQETVTDDMVQIHDHLENHASIIATKASTYALTNLESTVSVALGDKADRSYVDNELGTKVGTVEYSTVISDIHAELALRVTQNALDGALLLKADKTALDGLTLDKADVSWVDARLTKYMLTADIISALSTKLDVIDGKIPAHYLPSYVDAIVEYENEAAFPALGVAGRIYVDMAEGTIHRWSGSGYVLTGSDLALGETATTAFRGDHGRFCYSHSASAHAPADAEKNVQADWSASSGDSFIKNKPSTFTPSAHTHVPSEVGLGGIPTTISDSIANSSSGIIASSKAVKTAFDKGASAYSLASSKADIGHNHDSSYPGISHNETITGAYTFTKVVTSSIGFVKSSDRRIKEGIVAITDAEKKSRTLVGCTYTRNDIEDQTTRHAGLIAQDVNKVLPEAVFDDGTGKLGIDYNSVVALLIQTNNEQADRLDKLEAEVRALKLK